MVPVTAGWGRPSSVHTIGKQTLPCVRSSRIWRRYIVHCRVLVDNRCEFQQIMKTNVNIIIIDTAMLVSFQLFVFLGEGVQVWEEVRESF